MRRFRVYISCSAVDARWGANLERFILGCRAPVGPPGRRGRGGLGPVHRREGEIPTTRAIGGVRRAALAGSDSLIVICAPGAARSVWVDEEIREFRRRRPGGRILGLVADGREGGEPFIPGAFHDVAGPAVRTVDARRGGWKAAARAAAALCLGVEPEDIAAAFRARRRRRFFGAVAGAAAAMGIAGCYLIVDGAERARAALKLAHALAADAQAALDRDETLSALRLIDSAFALPLREPSPALNAALARAALETRLLAETPAPEDDIVALRALPHGAVAAMTAAGGAWLIDPETHETRAVYAPQGRAFSRISDDGLTLWTAHFDEARTDESGAPYAPLLFEETDLATGETRLATAVRSVAEGGGAGEISADGAFFAVDLGPGAGTQTMIGVFRRAEQELAGMLRLPSDRADLWFVGPDRLLALIDPPSAHESAPGLYLWRIGARAPQALRPPGLAPFCPGAAPGGTPARPQLLLSPDRREAGLLFGDGTSSCILRWDLLSGATKPVLNAPAAAAATILAANGPYLLFPDEGEALFLRPGEDTEALPGCGRAGAGALGDPDGELEFFCQEGELSSLFFGADAAVRWSRVMHEGGVAAAAYDPVLRRLITLGRDERIRIWDAAPRLEAAEESRSAGTAAAPPAGSGCGDGADGYVLDRVADETGARLALRTRSAAGGERVLVYDLATCSRLMTLDAKLSGPPRFDGAERLLLPMREGVAALSLAVDVTEAREELERRLAMIDDG